MCEYMFVRDQVDFLPDMKKTKIVCNSYFPKGQAWLVHACSEMLFKFQGI